MKNTIILHHLTRKLFSIVFRSMNAEPQKQYASVVMEVLPTQLIPDDTERKVLRVRLIMKESGVKNFQPIYIFDEGSTISWVPCGRKLTCSYPGIKFFCGPEAYFENEVILSQYPKFSFSFH